MLSHYHIINQKDELLLWRRRKGLTIAQAAAKFGVTPQKYFRIEHAREGPIPSKWRFSVKKLKLHEICFLLRRANGLSQHDLAEKIGCCRWWLNQMERGLVPNQELIKYWNSHGTSKR